MSYRREPSGRSGSCHRRAPWEGSDADRHAWVQVVCCAREKVTVPVSFARLLGMNDLQVRTEPIRIDAPAGLVWKVLTDVERYGEWNPFTPQVRTDFRIGSPARLLVRMGPAKVQITETVSAFEAPRLIAWGKTFGARWLLAAMREQHLEPVGGTSCRYYNTDRLTGLLAPLVLFCSGGYMRSGFTDAGEGLKRQSEALYKKSKPRG